MHKLLLFLCFFIVNRHACTHTYSTHTKQSQYLSRIGAFSYCILLLKNAVWKITIWHSLRAAATPDRCHPASSFPCIAICCVSEQAFFLLLFYILLPPAVAAFAYVFVLLLYFSLSHLQPPKNTRDELFAYCLLRKMENNKKMKNEENKNSSYRWWVFSCVVAQNIKQHSEEFEDEGEEEVAEKFSNLISFFEQKYSLTVENFCNLDRV